MLTVGRSVGRLDGRSVGRSVGRLVGWMVAREYRAIGAGVFDCYICPSVSL